MGKIVFRNENDIFECIKKINDGTDFADFTGVEFKDFGKLKLHLSGDDYDQTLTPSSMQALLDLQTAIYKTYCLAKHNSQNTNRLTREERKELELLVYVGKGSSSVEVDIGKIIEKYVGLILDKMNSKEILIVVTIFSATWLTHSLFYRYLESTEKKLSSNNLVSLTVAQAKENTEQLKIINEMILNNNKIAVDTIEIQNKALNSIVKAIANTDSTDFNGLKIDGNYAESLIKSPVAKFVDVRLDGFYKIMSVDSSNDAHFKVALINTKTNNKIQSALLQSSSLDPSSVKLIQRAEWGKTVIELKINAKQYQDRLKDAVILGIESSDDENN